MKRLVIALGGNALGNNPEEQLELVKQTAKTIVDLSEEGYNVIVGHGNGPQVGMINLAMDFASSNGANTPSMPFAECGSCLLYTSQINQVQRRQQIKFLA